MKTVLIVAAMVVSFVLGIASAPRSQQVNVKFPTPKIHLASDCDNVRVIDLVSDDPLHIR